MGKHISSKKLTDKITLSECTDGFWLYDKQRGMNLSMRAKTETDAFVEALDYYQRRDIKLGTQISGLKDKISKIHEILGVDENED